MDINSPTENSADSSGKEEYIQDAPAENAGGNEDASELVRDTDPVSVQQRLNKQASRHRREMREMQEQVARLQNHVQSMQTSPDSQVTPFQQAVSQSDDPIARAVHAALQAQEAHKQQMAAAEQQAHVQKQYERLNQHFDKASEKYEDFDDVVRGNDAPFSHAIRDALLLVDNPAEVAYKLGKNRDDLSRIAKLHPIDQAREVNKLSFALMGGNNNALSQGQSYQSQPMNGMRPKPQSTTQANTVDAIRQKMKSGTWK